MRWEALFADLEAQAEALAEQERGAAIAELVRLETSRLELLDRLRPALGSPLKLRCLGGVVLTGQLRRISREWLLLDEGAGREALVATASLGSVAGVGRLSGVAATMSQVDSRLGIGQVLRTVATDRSVLRTYLSDATVLDGTLDRVAKDFVEIAVHPAGELRRRADVREVLIVPIGALAVLRRDN